jgi:hypothetical protein
VIRRAVGLLLPILALHCQPAIGACSSAPVPMVTVTLDASQPIVDGSRSISDLTRFPAARSKGTESYDHALGLTDTTINTDAHVETLTTVEPSDGYCSSLFRARVRVVWRTMVYVASEIPPHSCTYRATLTHEQKHVAVDREMRAATASRVRSSIAAVAKSAYAAKTEAQSQEILRRKLSAAITKALNAIQAELKARQLQIDTPEEYDSLERICGAAEVQRILRE